MSSTLEVGPIRIRPAFGMGGYQQLLRADAMRGKFRNRLQRPEAFVSGAADGGRFYTTGRLSHIPQPDA